MEFANAEDIVLTTAQMHGLSIDNGNKFHAVTAVKSEREPNTYLFAIADGVYTKINKVRLYNDSETGQLKYYSEAWFKRGNHLAELARADVSSAGDFVRSKQSFKNSHQILGSSCTAFIFPKSKKLADSAFQFKIIGGKSA